MANAASQLANAVMTAGENAAASFRSLKSSGIYNNQYGNFCYKNITSINKE